MPVIPETVDDFGQYLTEAAQQLHEHDFAVLIGDKKYTEASIRVDNAIKALEKAHSIIIRLYFKQLREKENASN